MTSYHRHCVIKDRQPRSLFNCLSKIITKRYQSSALLALREGAPPVTSQRANNAESVFMSWRHHISEMRPTQKWLITFSLASKAKQIDSCSLVTVNGLTAGWMPTHWLSDLMTGYIRLWHFHWCHSRGRIDGVFIALEEACNFLCEVINTHNSAWSILMLVQV